MTLKFNFTLVLILFMLVSGNPVFSQSFPLLTKKSEKSTVEEVNNYKYSVSKKVFDRLVNAMGDKRQAKPNLIMQNSDRYGCVADLKKAQIWVEENTYDICREFGSDSLNALAILLAKPLIHYYDRDDPTLYFPVENPADSTTQALYVDNLAKASYLVYLAGFDGETSVPGIFGKLYDGYAVGKQIDGFPTKAGLKSAWKAADSKVKQWKLIKETSDLMTILADYETAATYKAQDLSNFQTLETLNFAGINSLMAALEYVGPREVPFILPMELDPNGRLVESRNMKNDSLGRRKAFLQLAISQFDKTIQLDSGFLDGYQNKGCALALAGAFETANECLQIGLELCSTPKLTTNFLVMQGIVAAMQGNNNLAAQKMEKAKKIGDYLATQNLNILRNKIPPTLTPTFQNPVKGVEKIEWFPLENYLNNPETDLMVTVKSGLSCGVLQKALSTVYLQKFDELGKTIAIQQTISIYKGNTLRDIKLISTADNVQEAYGVPKRNISMPGEFVWVYPESGIYFRFKDLSTLKSWGIFVTQEHQR